MKKEFLKLKGEIILIDNYLFPRAVQVNGIEGMVYPINSTGIMMLSLCDGTHRISDIIDYVAQKYNINEKIVKRDAKTFFEVKIKQNIVELTDKCVQKNVDFRGREDVILPYQLSIETTNQCQLKCKHCYNDSRIQRDNELTTDELINILEQYKRLGGISVMLTGGEILLKDEVTRLLDYVAKNFLRVIILTNGFYIKEEIFEKLRQYKENLAIQISIDGLANNHDYIRGVQGAYEKTIANVKKLVNAGLTVSVASTLNEKNRNDIFDLTRIIKEIGCASINIGAVASIGRAKESNISSVDVINNLKDTVKTLRSLYGNDEFIVGENIEEYDEATEVVEGISYDNKCGAGYKILHLFADGKIGLCPSHGSIINKYWLGDLKKNSLEEILKFENMKHLLSIPNPSKKLCGDCHLYDECAQCIVTMLNRNKDECLLKGKVLDEKIIDMQE